MNSYSVSLADGSEAVQVTAATCSIVSGTLMFTDQAGFVVASFAPNVWSYCVKDQS